MTPHITHYPITQSSNYPITQSVLTASAVSSTLARRILMLTESHAPRLRSALLIAATLALAVSAAIAFSGGLSGHFGPITFSLRRPRVAMGVGVLAVLAAVIIWGPRTIAGVLRRAATRLLPHGPEIGRNRVARQSPARDLREGIAFDVARGHGGETSDAVALHGHVRRAEMEAKLVLAGVPGEKAV